FRSRARSTFEVKATGWLKGLEVTGGGTGVVSHAGLALLRALADNTGLTGGLSEALATPRSRLRPYTYRQRSAMTSMSAAEVFISAAVLNVPPSHATMA